MSSPWSKGDPAAAQSVEAAGSVDTARPGPAIVLVEPQLGFNIGACARAMLNCGLRDLRIVRPRDGWPNEKARSAATVAVDVVDRARVFERTEEAVADLHLVFATTGRTRDLHKEILEPPQAAAELLRLGAEGLPTGVLFGPERTGLENADLVLAHKILTFPLDPACRSLNLAQAVMLVAWEWHRARLNAPRQETPSRDEEVDVAAQADSDAEKSSGVEDPHVRRRQRRQLDLDAPATAGELAQLYEHLEQELDAAHFFRVPEKREGMILNLRALLARAAPTRQETRTLHGVVTALSGRRKDGSRARRPGSKHG